MDESHPNTISVMMWWRACEQGITLYELLSGHLPYEKHDKVLSLPLFLPLKFAVGMSP